MGEARRPERLARLGASARRRRPARARRASAPASSSAGAGVRVERDGASHDRARPRHRRVARPADARRRRSTAWMPRRASQARSSKPRNGPRGRASRPARPHAAAARRPRGADRDPQQHPPAARQQPTSARARGRARAPRLVDRRDGVDAVRRSAAPADRPASGARRQPPTTAPSSSQRQQDPGPRPAQRHQPHAAAGDQGPAAPRAATRPHRPPAPAAPAVASGTRSSRERTALQGSIRSRIAASFASPMPGTSSRPSTLANGPCSSRQATMRCAVAGPTPGSVSSAVTSAWLRRTTGGLPGVGCRADRRRATAHRHHHLLAVGDGCGQVQAVERRAARGTARGRDRVAGTGAVVELVDARMPHRADHVHERARGDRRAGRRSEDDGAAAAAVPDPGDDARRTGRRRGRRRTRATTRTSATRRLTAGTRPG